MNVLSTSLEPSTPEELQSGVAQVALLEVDEVPDAAELEKFLQSLGLDAKGATINPNKQGGAGIRVGFETFKVDADVAAAVAALTPDPQYNEKLEAQRVAAALTDFDAAKDLDQLKAALRPILTRVV